MIQKPLPLAMLLIIFLSACTTLPPPSNEGVSRYHQGDFAGSFNELQPLADRGDRQAQYYLALMSLENTSPHPSAADEAIELLVQSASQGQLEAFALLILLQMTIDERAAFEKITRYTLPDEFELREGVLSDDAYYSIEPKRLTDEVTQFAENSAGGPLSVSTILFMAQQSDDILRWPPDSQAVTVTDTYILRVDQTLADAGDKYAQTRMGSRYALGRGTPRDLEQALKWQLKAAKTTSAPRNCVYQAPVGGGRGSTYCYDSGNAVAGLPQAMLEVCRAYAFGHGADKDIAKARKWCERASSSEKWKGDAHAIMTSAMSQ